ncbi:MAG: four helix bundle protein [Chitinophagaceae bacterium]
MTNYRNLDAWKQGMALVELIYGITKGYPIDERYGLIAQTRRAAVSVPSNIAEGLGRNHKKDTIQFLHISRGSLYELETLLEIAVMTNYIEEPAAIPVRKQLNDCIRLMNGLIRYFENMVEKQDNSGTSKS